MVGDTVYYGKTDGFLYRRTFNGTTFGAEQQINPYHDPFWKDVDNNLGGTYDGASPTLYSQMPNVTGMTFYGAASSTTRCSATPPARALVQPGQRHRGRADLQRAQQRQLLGRERHVRRGQPAVLRQQVQRQPQQRRLERLGHRQPVGDQRPWGGREQLVQPVAVPVHGPRPNQAPTAAFTSSCTNATCSFDGSGSTDSDGSVASYAWKFGDGSTGTGATPSHTYAAAGTYTVRSP